jgi:diacylglycerol kinase (ATP)
MKATLIHNPTAGRGKPTPDELCAEVRAVGFDVDYVGTDRKGWKAALQDPGDLVISAGGDGTVGKIVRATVRRPVRLAMLPLGTANNLATALGIRGDWRDLVRRLPEAPERRLDIGIALGPDGERVFLEGVGFGLIAAAMAAADEEPAEENLEPGFELRMDLRRIKQRLRRMEPRRCSLETNTGAVETEALLVGVMNIRSVGPRVDLAPQATGEDGLLHVVVAREEHREALDHYLDQRLAGKEALLELDTYPTSWARVCWDERLAHIDDRLWQKKKKKKRKKNRAEAFFACVPSALRILVPRA